MKNTILVVDDEPDIRTLIKEILEDEGFEVDLAENGNEAQKCKQDKKPDLILLDIWMPDIDGVTILKEWTENNEFNSPVIMMSGHGTVETAVEATRLGAYDFLEKPLSLAKLVLTVKNALEASRLQRENTKLRQYQKPAFDIIGKSKIINELRDKIELVANHKTPVLILGESGTDKEVIARYLHSKSERAEFPFISVNISALSTSEPSAEIFGREKDGEVVQQGYIEQADGGTLFLKDIADMDLNTQAKLQSALESKYITRVGGVSPVPFNVRIIAATSSRLEQQVKEGNFRDDFYFQLNVLPVTIPPLREHFEDIPELLEYFVNFFVDQEGLAYRHFSTSAQNRLRRYNWPGNLRELKNLVQRMLILGRSETIEVDEVEAALANSHMERDASQIANFDLPLREARERFEKAYLEYQLKQANGSVSKIARTVGMERTHLYRKLKSLGIELKN
jgi:DNA-binding NtrC family response regulator